MASRSRYLVGIDLGTTNSVVAYVDTHAVPEDVSRSAQVFDVAQVIAPGEVRAVPALPSFLYFPTEAELESGTLSLPWEERPTSIAGAMARDQGALVPGRQVSSAKSWLCQDAVNRTSDILPRDAEASEPRISPVEASARYLVHLRDAWNHAMTLGTFAERFEHQAIVLTVPASFDEEARELTVEAARRAGLENLTLLEEPLAAFYAWISQNRHGLHEQLSDGDLVLVCDIGGGTSDFSLVRARVTGDDVQFERTAIGEHLLLGGENLDLALAHRVESKLEAKLSLRQQHALRISCAAAKERLLDDASLDRLPINVLGGGRAVVGQMLSSELLRDEVIEVLSTGLLPLTHADEMPARERRTGLREIGLPYATDPAITKHLGAFLRQAAAAMGERSSTTAGGDRDGKLAKPDAVLFNGGFCIPAIVRDRIGEAIANWFADEDSAWRPKILSNDSMGSAVAVGAAYYGGVRRGEGLRVKAGSARTYYIEMRTEGAPKTICVLPAGTDEGTTLPLASRQFLVLANRPVSFNLFSSTVRRDAHGAICELQSSEMHRHAPLVTVLRYGKKLQQMELAVRLSVSFTEVGTLELWCESLTSPHRWRLQFEVRGTDAATGGKVERDGPAGNDRSTLAASVSEQSLLSARELIGAVFSRNSEDEANDPAPLLGELEATLGLKRESWPLSVLRSVTDMLLAAADGRKLSPRHEARWLNLFGYCLRPGFGDPDDAARVSHARKIYQGGLAFPRDLQCQVDWLVLWRRIAAGLSAAHQHELRNYLGSLGIGLKRASTRLNSQVEHEGWRLLASLEHLSGATRAALGGELLRKLKKEPSDSGWLWSLGRLGMRIPVYGSLTCVVPPETAENWIASLLGLREVTHETASAVVQLGSRTGDRTRDVAAAASEAAIAKLSALGVSDARMLQRLRDYVPSNRAELAMAFGESVPRGMHLESTANCLSPVSALTAEPRKA